jgi:DNA-directed RNA polymerase subunit RPC12/RpoP
MKEEKFLSKLRKVSNTSLGLSLPKEICDHLELEDGELVRITVEKFEKEIHYQCGICHAEFSSNETLDLICPACGECYHLIKMENADD